jgi:hypothetical protein
VKETTTTDRRQAMNETKEVTMRELTGVELERVAAGNFKGAVKGAIVGGGIGLMIPVIGGATAVVTAIGGAIIGAFFKG